MVLEHWTVFTSKSQNSNRLLEAHHRSVVSDVIEGDAVRKVNIRRSKVSAIDWFLFFFVYISRRLSSHTASNTQLKSGLKMPIAVALWLVYACNMRDFAPLTLRIGVR